MKALFVDDEITVLESIKLCLKNTDIEVITTDNPCDAMKILKENKDIDVIITDYNMPNTDNMGWIKILKSLNSNKKILIISGYGIVAKAISDVPMLKKPFTKKDLLKFLKQ